MGYPKKANRFRGWLFFVMTGLHLLPDAILQLEDPSMMTPMTDYGIADTLYRDEFLVGNPRNAQHVIGHPLEKLHTGQADCQEFFLDVLNMFPGYIGRCRIGVFVKAGQGLLFSTGDAKRTVCEYSFRINRVL